jgi:hypothetical protein
MAETNALSLFPYAIDLFGGMIDLLQLEGVPATASPPKQPGEPNPGDWEGKGSRKTKAEDNREADEEDEESEPTSQLPPPTMDTQPTVANSKFPPLRRAALHFLALLIRACISRVYGMGSMGILVPGAYLTRASATLGYVASTDEDAVVRIMAREAGEGLEQLSNALVGL